LPRRVGTPRRSPFGHCDSGIAFGTDAGDPSTLYLSNYVWGASFEQNEIVVCHLSGGHCSIEGTLPLDGDIGVPFVQGDEAFATLRRTSRSTGRVDLSIAST
jgi:hypothetical protein